MVNAVVLVTVTTKVPLILGVELLLVITTISPVVKPWTADVVMTVAATAVLLLIVRLGPLVVITVGFANVLLTTRKLVPDVADEISSL